VAYRYLALQSFSTIVDRQRYRFVEGRMYDLAPNVAKKLAPKSNDYFKRFVDESDEVVEQATAAPGEKRTVKLRK
jgi:hypothetical protein